MQKIVLLTCCSIFFYCANAQSKKILFDASKAETASNADWIPDADQHNLGFTSTGTAQVGKGNESNPQITPSPAQSGITSTTSETYWQGALSYWGIDCVRSGYTVETLPYNGKITYGDITNAQDLKNYAVFIVCEPNIKFSTTEKTALINYVLNGGSLFLISDHTVSDRNGDGWDSPAIWNDFMTNNGIKNDPFGFSFDLQNFSQTSSNIPNYSTDSILHGPYGSVTQVLWSNGTSMTLKPTDNSTIKGIVYKTGSSFGNTNVMFAYGYYGKGKFAAIGDSSPCDDGTGDSNDQLYNGYTKDASGNHRRLLMNATIWLATHSTVLANNALYAYLNSNDNNESISWSTSAENTAGSIFNIQKSTDGKNYIDVASITAKEGLNNYSYNLPPDNNAKEYLRIVQTNNQSSPLYSNIVIDDDKNFSCIHILQNPVQAVLQASLQPSANSAYIFVYNSLGRLVLQQQIAPYSLNINIDVSRLGSGIYNLVFTDDKKNKTELRFVKE